MKLDTKSSLMQRRLAKKAKMIPAELLWTRISVEKNSITKPSLEKELVKKMSMSMKVQPVEGGLDVPTCRRLPSYKRS